MGNYNPRTPHILGQEWVPIRNEDLTFTPALNSVERGSQFSLSQSRILQDGRFYLNTAPPGSAAGETFMIGVYPRGTEAESGPIQSVIIPCNNGGITGNASLSGASVAVAMADPADFNVVQMSSGSPSNSRLDMYFATNSYSNLLTGKRILAVNLLYTAAGNTAELIADTNSPNASLGNDSSNVFYGSMGTGAVGADQIVNGLIPPATTFRRVHFGEINPYWLAGTAPTANVDRMPWTYTQLQRLEASSANRLAIRFTMSNSTGGRLFLVYYAALEVIFCEENRVALGGRAFGFTDGFQACTGYIIGANPIPMRTLAGAANPTLAAGDYSVVLSSADTGDMAAGFEAVANLASGKLNSLRELYALPNQAGVQTNLTNTVGKTFTKVATHIIPQLSLHTSGGALTEVHSYGRQAIAPVFGSITATQEILDSVVSSTPYPWVRFYARRFGDTRSPLLLSSASPTVSGGCVRVEITPSEFDTLDEIVDGWKEITLRFPCVPNMGGGFNPQWIFSASTETASNRWEVLGAQAPALSGLPGNLLNLATAQLGSTTYGSPGAGTTINLGWMSPNTTVTTDDAASDATLLFSMDMPTITGFSVVGASQAVTGIGQDCGIDPCGIPNAISYNHLSWTIPPPLNVLADSFTRVTASGWGNADSGQAWTADGGVAGDYSTSGSQGLMTLTPAGTRHNMVSAATYGDSDFSVTMTAPSTISSQEFYLYSRYTDANNHYSARISLDVSGAVSVRLIRLVGGVSTFISSATNVPATVFAGDAFKARLTTVGSSIAIKVWDVDSSEPDVYAVTAFDTTYTSGFVGLGAVNNVTAPLTATFDNVLAIQPYVFGNYELQRSDTVEPAWQTIMSATSPNITSFNDYEARIGIATSYRIRGNNIYDFPGQWSSTVSITTTSPGVSGSCLTQAHILVFTSNERQNGSANLAYSSVWEGNAVVEEGFTFPEANFVQLQAMYNRDFYVAFRPLERGGEQFTRTLLVQAAAIAPETLADFTSLRNMAWDSVPYICVRDEDGNRWFASVTVPSGRVLRDRRLYMATVTIVEVTDTPSPVDPS